MVIEGFSPGTTDGWGVDADALCTLNPHLVHCAITAFGPTGPYAMVKGYDTLVSAKVGLFARGGYAHRDGPIMYNRPWGSHGAAMQSVAAILGALLVREQTGRGQRLLSTLVAGMDPVDYFLTTVVQLMAKRGELPALDARSATEASRYGVLVVTRDGRFIQTSTMLPHQGRALCEVAGIGHLVNDPRFARLPMFATAEDAQEWEDLLWEAFRKEDLEHWLPRLMASPDVAFEVAVTCEQGLDHPQIVHNGDVITVPDPTVGPIREVGPIGRFSETPCRIERSAPALGDNHGPFAPAAPVVARGDAPEHPLSGVTIVEFGYFYAMPYGLTLAAALGARVIKLEDANGDPHRRSFGEEVASAKTTAGKESVSLDLSSPEGQEIAHRIVAGADVFVTGFRTGVAEKLGLGYDELRAINPRLLYVHAAGYGSDGPYARRALYAQPAQTVAGSFGRQVGYWAEPARNLDLSVVEVQVVVQPRLNQVVDGDSNAALSLLAAAGARHLPPAAHRAGAALGDVDDRRERVGILGRLQHLRGEAARTHLRQRVLRHECPRARALHRGRMGVPGREDRGGMAGPRIDAGHRGRSVRFCPRPRRARPGADRGARTALHDAAGGRLGDGAYRRGRGLCRRLDGRTAGVHQLRPGHAADGSLGRDRSSPVRVARGRRSTGTPVRDTRPDRIAVRAWAAQPRRPCRGRVHRGRDRQVRSQRRGVPAGLRPARLIRAGTSLCHRRPPGVGPARSPPIVTVTSPCATAARSPSAP